MTHSHCTSPLSACVWQKFLVSPDGESVKRYSRYFDTNAIAADIDAFL